MASAMYAPCIISLGPGLTSGRVNSKGEFGSTAGARVGNGIGSFKGPLSGDPGAGDYNYPPAVSAPSSEAVVDERIARGDD